MGNLRVKWSLIRMRSALKLVTLCVTVYCLPGPNPGAYHFTKTVWVAEKGASSPALKIGDLEKSVANNITLVGGGSDKEGNVLLNGKPICDDKWDDRDAKVVCRMLGFSSDGAFATTQSQFGLVSGDFIMDDVQCKGAEKDLNDCYHRDKHNCGAGEGAGVRCRVSAFDDDLKEELEEIREENEKLQEIVTALRTQLDDLASNVTELEGTVGFDDTVLTDLISSSDDFSEHISSFNDSLTSLATSVNDHETKLGSHHDQIHSVIVKTASNSKKVDNVTQNVVNLKASVQKQETKFKSLTSSVQQQAAQIKSVSTYGKWCGFQSGWSTSNSIITYQSLKFARTNMGITGTPLNINTGVFTVPVAGVWRVTYSLFSRVHSNEDNQVYVYFNGNQLWESVHYTHSSSGTDFHSGGREVTVSAGNGDTIYLKTGTMERHVETIYFCVAFENKI